LVPKGIRLLALAFVDYDIANIRIGQVVILETDKSKAYTNVTNNV
jgi:hypothetical protein